MVRVDGFLMTTDFDTIKNDDATTASVTIPGSTVIAAGVTLSFSSTVTVGEAQSILNVMYTNNIDLPGGYYVVMAGTYRADRTGKVGGADVGYSIIARFSHTGGNNVRVLLSIQNTYGSPLTIAPTSETWNFIIKSIKVPRFV